MGSRGKARLPIDTLKEAMEYADLLQHASHVLENNIEILTAVRDESIKRQNWSVDTSPADEAAYDALRSGIEDTSRELRFAQRHILLIHGRLQGSAVRDVVTLQNSYTMERMTVKSVQEARAVRIIALVTLLYLPPSFTAALFGMGYLHTTAPNDSSMDVRADPDFYFYLAITLPLMLVTLAGWFAWNIHEWRRSGHLYGVEKPTRTADVELGLLGRMSFRATGVFAED